MGYGDIRHNKVVFVYLFIYLQCPKLANIMFFCLESPCYCTFLYIMNSWNARLLSGKFQKRAKISRASTIITFIVIVELARPLILTQVVCCLHYNFRLSRIIMLLYISVYHEFIKRAINFRRLSRGMAEVSESQTDRFLWDFHSRQLYVRRLI